MTHNGSMSITIQVYFCQSCSIKSIGGSTAYYEVRYVLCSASQANEKVEFEGALQYCQSWCEEAL